MGREKPIKIKAWPELDGFNPISSVFRDLSSKGRSVHSPIELDFGSVRSATSTGLAVFFLSLMRKMGDRKISRVHFDCPSHILKTLERLGTFDLIREIQGQTQPDLPFTNEKSRLLNEGSTTTSIPVYRLRITNHSDPRAVVHEFVMWLAQQLQPLSERYKIEVNGLAMMLNEIAKNSSDHAKSDALFGLDIKPIDTQHMKLSFVFGDMGVGIKKHIEQHLPPEVEQRKTHMSLYEAYRLALKPGYTSNHGSKINKGYGMSIIMDCAEALSVDLSIFDAESRGVLSYFDSTDNPSHSAVRRIFHHMGHDVRFFYYGESILERRI